MKVDPHRLRNIGIFAHIDSGKTTLTERVLFYTRRIRQMHEVKGSDGVGATMDSMELERERGITIASAATYCRWLDHHLNIIDTPGHVDFTMEVERSLRVLDGAVLVLCAVGGVQSQSFTVDRQMRRYRVPRVVFINKCDRIGANPLRVCDEVHDRLGLNPVLLQLPVGLEDRHEGVIDLVEMRSLIFEGENGERVVAGPIPPELAEAARQARERLLDAVSMISEELTQAILEERVTPALIRAALRRGTLDLQLTPVLLGSAYRNRGVQPLLDAVVHYLPAPSDLCPEALDLEHEDQRHLLRPDPEAPTVALAFKLEDGRYGQLTYLRLYQGRLRRDDTLVNMRTGDRHRVGRLVRMHADEMEEITEAAGGDIVAMFGVECGSGDTFTDGRIQAALTPMHVPEPVVSLSVRPADAGSEAGLHKALRRFAREDPTFRVETDPDSGETVVRGMGELHLEVYLERVRREYRAQVVTSAPQVAYRETITRRVDFDYIHKKQTGGAGQYARVCGYLEPAPEVEFVDATRGGSVPRQFIPSVEKGFRSMLARGPCIGFPVVNLRLVLNDGAAHAVDSSDLAFQEATRGAFREAYPAAQPQVLEPIMRVVVEGPAEHAGVIMGGLQKRRGAVVGAQEDGRNARVEAEVPLEEMFGYAGALRSSTQGKAEFTMEFARYLPVPAQKAEELIERYRRRRGGDDGA
ncbi:MAG: elongation factor G [Myxococcales bacterium]|nr:elongation factor G [Myxococcales bacterium]